ncbi:AsmA family protein [Chelatococcus reniformis]|uniref:Membrane protein n=1 Tax=Chelatococcus reniformis TaxID=1494448 RepID=A0A916URE1_9HYPH|nr:AsmA-like C-terminal region-containing protein [Chelatococcus reniformis]GGC84098.1 membrane protein [Chelatococcus reniformis]
MRDLLTAIAVLVIVALLAALLGPPLIDWSAHRGRVEALLGDALGVPVHTRGHIGVRLLPSPALTLEGLAIGEGRGPASLAAGETRVELSLSPLLRGDVQIADAAMDQPVLTIRLAEDGGLAWPGLGPDGLLGRLAVERVRVTRGAIVIADRVTGRDVRLSRLEAIGQASSVDGPWQVAGAVEGQPFRFSTGQVEPGGERPVKAAVGNDLVGRLALEGKLSLAAKGATPLLVGKVSATRPLTADEPLTLTANADVELVGRRLALRNVDLSAGDGSIKLTGAGSLDLGRRVAAELTLGARHMALDKAVAQLRPVMEEGGLGPVLGIVPLPVTARVAFDRLSWADEEAQSLSALIRLDGRQVAVEQLSLRLPGETNVTADGTLQAADQATAAFRVAVRVGAPPRLGLALSRLGASQALATQIAREQSLTLDANVALSPTLIGLSNVRMAAGPVTVAGAFRYSFADEREPPRLDAQLTAEQIDLARWPALSDVGLSLGTADLGLLIDARGVRYGPSAGAGRVRAKLSRSAGHLAIDALEIRDLAGINASGTGSIGPRGDGRVNANVTAERAGPAFGLLAKLGFGVFAGPWPAGVEDAPLDLKVVASASGADPARRIDVRLDGAALGGSVAGQARLAWPAARLVDASLTFNTPETARVLATWGFAGEGRAAIGPAVVTAILAEPPKGTTAQQLTLGGQIAGIDVRTAAPIAMGPDVGSWTKAAFQVSAKDASRLARALGGAARTDQAMPLALGVEIERDGTGSGWQALLDGSLAGSPVRGTVARGPDGAFAVGLATDQLSVPALASVLALGPLPAARAGGIWPSERFAAAPAWLDGVAADRASVHIKAGRLDLGGGLAATQADLTVRKVADGVALGLDRASFAGGSLAGETVLRRLGSGASFTTDLRLDQVDITTLAGAGDLAGRVSGTIRAGGSGESVAAIVANLSGTGSLKATNVMLKRVDPGALGEAAAGAGDDTQTLDPRALGTQVDRLLQRAFFQVRTIDVPLLIGGGVARASPTSAEAGPARLEGALTIDLRTLTLEAAAILSTQVRPPGWKGGPAQVALRWQGPIGAPRREVDANALANGLASIRLGKELERIQAFEAEAKRLKEERERREAEERARREAEERARREAELKERHEAEQRAEEAVKAQADARERERQDQLRRAAERSQWITTPGSR